MADLISGDCGPSARFIGPTLYSMAKSRFLWPILVIVLFCVPLFVGLGRSDAENDEAIYSYATESILETGDWLNPRVSPWRDVVFLEKPPLKFWIVALPIKVGALPNNDFGLRFWDALFGSIAFLYVFALGRRMAGPFCGVMSVMVLFTVRSLIFVHGLRGNNMEAALVLAYCGGVYHYLRWWEGQPTQSRPHAVAVGLYFVLGFMTKFVPPSRLAVLDRHRRTLLAQTTAGLEGVGLCGSTRRRPRAPVVCLPARAGRTGVLEHHCRYPRVSAIHRMA